MPPCNKLLYVWHVCDVYMAYVTPCFQCQAMQRLAIFCSCFLVCLAVLALLATAASRPNDRLMAVRGKENTKKVRG